MTRKVYKSALGKEVDLGALFLQNEHVRAVGNMNVNARGDKLDGNNVVIDQKVRQSQRQYQRQTTNVSADVPVHRSTRAAKQAQIQVDAAPIEEVEYHVAETVEEVQVSAPVVENITPIEAPAPVEPDVAVVAGGGLAAAIARSKAVNQTLEKTPRQAAKEAPLRKI
jgi:hypothetical protein